MIVVLAVLAIIGAGVLLLGVAYLSRDFSRKVAEITGLRARSKATGLPLKDMRLIAEAASVEVVKDGKELKVVRMF